MDYGSATMGVVVLGLPCTPTNPPSHKGPIFHLQPSEWPKYQLLGDYPLSLRSQRAQLSQFPRGARIQMTSLCQDGTKWTMGRAHVSVSPNHYSYKLSHAPKALWCLPWGQVGGWGRIMGGHRSWGYGVGKGVTTMYWWNPTINSSVTVVISPSD